MNAPALTPDQFRDVMGRFASGVTVITTTRDGEPLGSTASAVSSLSLEPPMLLICMNTASATGRAIADQRRFAVNVLGEDQSDLAVRFAGKGADKFRGADVSEGAAGIPLLAGALAVLECRVTEIVRGGTHYVFLAEVERASGRAGAPLAYFCGQFGRLELAQDESVLREVRERVMHRRVPVGEPLDIDRLADELRAPRGSVYHALAKLSGEGLVDRDASGSFVVPRVTLESLLESARARLAVFLGAATLSLGDASASELAELRRLLAGIRPDPQRPVPIDEWFRARTAFVDFLMRLSGGTSLLEAFRRADVPAQILALWSGATAPDPADLESIHDAYAEIVRAFELQDLALLRRTVGGLLRFYDDLYRRSFIGPGGI